MSRTLPSTLESSLSAVVTKPRALLELEYSTVLWLYSDWPAGVTHDAKTWVAGGFDFGNYEERPTGAQELRVTIPHQSLIMGTDDWEVLFVTEGFDGQSASFYYFDEDADESAILLSGGTVEDGSIGELDTNLIISGKIGTRNRAPRLFFAKPAFNTDIPAGTHLFWQGQQYNLEKE